MNKIKYVLLFLLFIILAGCDSKITAEDLIGGHWIITGGYKEGHLVGDSTCSPSIEEGLEIQDKDTVYVKVYDRDFAYSLEENGTAINFKGKDLGIYISYYIDKINENEIGLIGEGEMQKNESCYLERK